VNQNQLVPLPMGDLWRPYEYDADGAIVQRLDNVQPQERNALSMAANRSPDVAAILAAENARLRDEAAAVGVCQAGEVVLCLS
jgi:hypothetical protein